MTDGVTPRRTTAQAGPHAPPHTLGVLGGMGPAATADFLAQLAYATGATTDQEHPATLVYSDPSTPDRSAAISGCAPSPAAALLAGVRFLDQAGCVAIAIPCNTAHHWFDDLQEAVSIPILHIVDAVADAIELDHPHAVTVGLLATRGTITAGIYPRRLAERGLEVVVPDEVVVDESLMPAVRAAKAGELGIARGHIDTAAHRLATMGAEVLVIACTDLSVAIRAGAPLAARPTVDANGALATRCVSWLGFPPAERSDALGGERRQR